MAFSRSNDRSGKRDGFRLAVLVGALLLVLVTAGGAAAGKAKHTAKPSCESACRGRHHAEPLRCALGGRDTNTFYSLAYAPLIHQLPNGKFAPGLATSWRYFPTGKGRNKGFELTLRHNAKFSDGTPVTATAVANDLNAYATGTAAFATWLGPKPSFNADGKYKVRIRTQIGTPSLDYILSDGGLWGWIVAPAAVSDQNSRHADHVWAGPYKLDSSAPCGATTTRSSRTPTTTTRRRSSSAKST